MMEYQFEFARQSWSKSVVAGLTSTTHTHNRFSALL